MANTIKIRRSATQGAVPTTAQLALGELAVNTYDGKLFLKKNVTGVESIVEIGAGGGGGASVSISDTAPSSPTAGALWWRSSEGQLYIYYDDGNTSQWVVANAFTGGSAYLPLTGGSVTGPVTVSSTLSVTENFSFNSGYGSSAVAYGCRAWVNFNGTGTVAIRASGNVSSITDNGTGTYTVNFANALPDANYCVNAGCKNSTNVDHNYYAAVNRNTAQTTTSVRIVTIYFSNLTAFDNDFVFVSIFR